MNHFLKLTTTILFVITFCINNLNAQSLSGVWEGEYTHYFPTCCDGVRYKCKFNVYEDGRGTYWIESILNPVDDPNSIGRFFTGGFKADEKIYFIDVKETFSSFMYTTTCYRNCRWCSKEYSLRYKKQGNKEILYGVWNSMSCHPGGDIEITKTGEISIEDKIRIVEAGKATSQHYDPGYMQRRYPPLKLRLDYKDSTKLAVNIGSYSIMGEHYPFYVANPKDLVDRKDDIQLQNVTMRLDSSGYQNIIYYELNDTKTGKIYTFNPYNISQSEVMDLEVSITGLTFPDRRQWEDILERAPKLPNSISMESIKPAKTQQTQFKNREVIASQAITVPSDEVELHIWDHSRIDGDIVSIYVNEECVLSKYTLERNKKIVNAKLKKGTNLITLHAENLGSIPPNTAAINVYVKGKLVKALVLRSDMNKSEAIQLEVKNEE